MPLVVHVLPDHEAVSQAVAGRLIAFAREFPAGTYALPSGNTPLRLYELLAEAVKAEQVHFGWANVFALDEYVGLGADDARSFAAFFKRHVFGPLGVAPGQGHWLDGLATDLEAEAARYEEAIAEAGGLNLTLLGLGANGHIAFNEPAPALQAHTHTATLAAPASDVAPQGVTMGVGTLLSAPKVMLMASGAGKADAVARMLSGTVDPACPASVLQLHPNVDVFLDRAAASKL
jgi:glucosamine-6-phosphate deaminase